MRIDGKEALVHTEFQTTDSTDTPMNRRMINYMGYIIAQYGLPVYSCVIYLRRNAGRHDPGRYTQKLPGHFIFVQYKVIRLSEMDGQSILDGGQAGLLPFAPLMKPPVGVDSETWLRQCIRKTDAMPLDHSSKIDFLGGLAVMSGLTYEPTTINRILSQEGFMDAIMRESSFAQYLKEHFKEQFIEQGIEQGIERGGREHTMDAILDVLEIRFDPAVADQVAGRIRAIEDLQRLKQLHRSAVQVADLGEFQRELDAEA